MSTTLPKLQFRALSKEVDGGTTRTYIALADGKPVGCIDVNDWHKPGGWISQVFVEEAYRRQGVARRMFSYIFSDARVAGKKGLGLSVKAENEAAQALYLGMGFRICYTYESGLYAMAIHL